MSLLQILSALELMDSESMAVAVDNLGLRNPLSTPSRFYLLVETHGSNATHDEEVRARALCRAPAPRRRATRPQNTRAVCRNYLRLWSLSWPTD